MWEGDWEMKTAETVSRPGFVITIMGPEIVKGTATEAGRSIFQT